MKTPVAIEPGRRHFFSDVKRNDYVSGPHSFWIHFVCGLIAGAGLAAWFGWRLFDSRWVFAGLVALSAVITAYCCGRWGDSAWEWLVEVFRWVIGR
jgi:hypothetical protein